MPCPVIFHFFTGLFSVSIKTRDIFKEYLHDFSKESLQPPFCCKCHLISSFMSDSNDAVPSAVVGTKSTKSENTISDPTTLRHARPYEFFTLNNFTFGKFERKRPRILVQAGANEQKNRLVVTGFSDSYHLVILLQNWYCLSWIATSWNF